MRWPRRRHKGAGGPPTEPLCRFHVLLALLVTFRISCCDLAEARSLPPATTNSDSAITHTLDYLQKFGYLPRSSSPHSGNLRSEKDLREAIRSMQRFAGLEPTGEVDAPTLALMRRKRCGMPDLLGIQADRVRRYALQGQKWDHNILTWTVSKATYHYMSLDVVRRQVSKALSVWSSAANITFKEVSRQDADIVVSFRQRYHEDGYPFDGQGSVLAHAFFPGEGIGGDAHFDADEKWTIGEPKGDGVNLFSVAAHEFGHSLGLSHSSVQGSLMFPYYQHITDSYQLHYDDQYGIEQLYGSKTNNKWGGFIPSVTQPPVRPNPVNPDRSNPNAPPAPTRVPGMPVTCNTDIDAISTIRQEVFIFKGKYFWRRDDQGLKPGDYPVPIDRFWKMIPSKLLKFDAVYERKLDNKIVFFSGAQYWVYVATDLDPGYPKPLSNLGLPADLKRIDAAMIWGHNGRTYFFSGKDYWRFDEKTGKVEPDYPRDMIIWKGVPTDLDAAFQSKNGKTYFFKGKWFWEFDDSQMRVTKDSPRLVSEKWFDCPPAGIPPSQGSPFLDIESHAPLFWCSRTQLLCVVVAIFLCLLNL